MKLKTATISKRERLIQVALKLFKREGFHAIGVDRIAREAGVTKKTLYHHFESKDELILAVLQYYDTQFREQFIQSVETRAKAPARRLLAVFDVAEAWFRQKDFHGCLFVGAMGEFPEGNTPIRNACRDAKNLMRDYIVSLARSAGAEKPGQLASQLLLLLEGAVTLAQVNHASFIAKPAKAAARVLIQNSCTALQK